MGPQTLHSPSPVLMNALATDIISTDYTFHAGGNDWMLCTVTVGQDQYALALYYAGLTAPLLWDDDITLEFSNGSLTVENNGQTYTMNYTSIYFKGNGDYVLMSSSAYIKEDSELIGFSIPTTDGGLIVSGTMDSLTGISVSDMTVGDATSAYEDTDYDDVFSLTGISVVYDTDQTAVCDNIIVPKSVSVVTTYEDATLDNLLTVIPLVMIVGIILVTVSFFLPSRK